MKKEHVWILIAIVLFVGWAGGTFIGIPYQQSTAGSGH